MRAYLVIKILFYISGVHPHRYRGVEKVQVKPGNKGLMNVHSRYDWTAFVSNWMSCCAVDV